MAFPTSGGRTPYVGTENVGDVLTKANYDVGPAGLAAYAQITTDTSFFAAGLSGINGLTVTFGATANRTYLITIQCASISIGGTGAATVDWIVYNQSTSTPLASVVLTNALNAGAPTFSYPGGICTALSQPGAGSKTFQAALLVTAQSGAPTCKLIASPSGSGARTGSITVQDVGSAF